MSDAIRFLETLAGKPAPLHACMHAYADEVAGLGVSDRQKRALLAGDVAALAGLLDARAGLICMVSTPDEQSPLREPDDDGADPDAAEEPDKED